jgi:hypothetical protein
VSLSEHEGELRAAFNRFPEHDESLAVLLTDEKLVWTVACVFNALLEKAKAAHTDDFVLNVIEPAFSEVAPLSNLTAGAMRTLVGQIRLVVG